MPRPNPATGRESYARVLANLASVLLGLAALAAVILNGQRPAEPPRSLPAAPPSAPSIAAVADKPPPPAPKVVPPAPKAPALDTAAVAKAEADLDALTRDRARAEARADDAARRLADASTQAAADSRASRNLAFRVRDPSTRVAQASARGGFLKAERDKLKGELATYASAPRPRAKVLSNKNPVARASDGDEEHFELRKDRIAYVDLGRLITLVKADAQLRIRLSEGARSVESQVGPVGPFALRYSMGRALPAGLDDLLERRGISYDLRGWEVVPTFEGRGESYETARQPISEYNRALGKVSPHKTAITLWVYPDSFPLFRKLRDDLQARGFLVAARPLPEGMAIRGSPSGSLSAGQ